MRSSFSVVIFLYFWFRRGRWADGFWPKYFQHTQWTRRNGFFSFLFWFIGFVLSIASAARSFLYLKTMNALKKKKKKKKRHGIWVTNHLLYTPGDWNVNTIRIHCQQLPHPHSQWAAPALSVSCTPPPSRLTSLIMSLGPGVLVSRGCLALLSPVSARASLPLLALAQSATPSRPCYRQQGLLFPVGENFSTGYSRFLRSLHLP